MSISNPQPFSSDNLPNLQQILGVAIFDPQGLPLEYFNTPHNKNMDWIQIAFQSLGLQQLLAIEMNLPSLDHAVLRTKAGNIVVVPTSQGFIALLIKRALPQESPTIDDDWIAWVCDFVETVVRTNPGFIPV